MGRAVSVNQVELSNGVSLPYVEQGSPDGVPVMLLHGATDSWRSYEPLLPHLPESLRAIAVTMRGHGDASRPDTGYAPGDFAVDIRELMDALSVPQAVVVEHSLGSIVGQRLAIDAGERVLGLVLIAGFFQEPEKPLMRELWDEMVAQLDDPVPEEVARGFQESTIAQPLPPGLLETFVSESLKVPARVWKSMFSALLAEDFRPDLAQVSVPTLLLWGDRDAAALESDQRALLASLPNARLITYAGAGHALQWEDPARVAQDIIAFIESEVVNGRN
jgi:non-heme chloroperoxidase